PRVAPAALGLGVWGRPGPGAVDYEAQVRRPAFAEIGLISSLDRGVRQSTIRPWGSTAARMEDQRRQVAEKEAARQREAARGEVRQRNRKPPRSSHRGFERRH